MELCAQVDKSPSERGKFTMPYVTPGCGVDASALALLQTVRQAFLFQGDSGWMGQSVNAVEVIALHWDASGMVSLTVCGSIMWSRRGW